MMNLIKLITLSIVLSITGCMTAEEPIQGDPAAAQVSELPPVSLAAPGGQNAAECTGDTTCPAQFNNCTFLGDFDCGEEFCRTPGAQCGGQPSTFIRVSHVSRCTDAAGNVCIDIRQGRRLVHCGC